MPALNSKGNQRYTMITVMITVIVSWFPGFSVADTTLEILDVDFPRECSAPFTAEAVVCSRCHIPDSREKFEITSHQQDTHIRAGYQSITSLDESSKITAFVPTQSLEQAVPFTQAISIRGRGLNSNMVTDITGNLLSSSQTDGSPAPWIRFSSRNTVQQHYLFS